MKVYHVERNFNLTLAQQKKELAKKYDGFIYLTSDGRKVHFVAN